MYIYIYMYMYMCLVHSSSLSHDLPSHNLHLCDRGGSYCYGGMKEEKYCAHVYIIPLTEIHVLSVEEVKCLFT